MITEKYNGIKQYCSRRNATGLTRAHLQLPQVMGHVFPQALLSVILTRQDTKNSHCPSLTKLSNRRQW